jgi:hypothetical protein
MRRKLCVWERFGKMSGALLAPVAGLGSLLRRARLFHPNGIVLEGHASPLGRHEHRELGLRLTGPVLVRFSSAWWRQRERADILGCALRFGTASAELSEPEPGDQDLLLATIRIPLTVLFAPFSTRVHDFLANNYFGVSPFRIRSLGRCRLRLVPLVGHTSIPRRDDALRALLKSGPVRLQLEVRLAKPATRYEPIALIELTRARSDDPDLYFDPFRCGRGIEPVGFVHHLRIATYAASRLARTALRRPASRAAQPRPTNGAPSEAWGLR